VDQPPPAAFAARRVSGPHRRAGDLYQTGGGVGALKTAIAPLLDLLRPVNEQIRALDTELERIVAAHDVARRLATAPGVGPVTAVAFVATVDDATRFRRAHQVEAYLGLVPCEWSSSEIQRRGQITKAGNGRMRWLLVQAAWCILRRRKKSETAALREWADRIAARRGRSIAAVAWRADWRGSSLQSGGMGRYTTPPGFGEPSWQRRPCKSETT